MALLKNRLSWMLPLLLAAFPLSTFAAGKAVVISTAAAGGETISCGCKKKDLGGLARRATVIDEIRSRFESVLLVDAGDFGSNAEYKPWMRTQFQYTTMSKLGYDVVTPGPNEMSTGQPDLMKLLASAPEIQVVSANITTKEGKLIWPESTVIEKGGVRFGVTGVTAEAYYSFNLTRGTMTVDDFAFTDVKEALDRVIPGLRKQCDVLVLLMHVGAAEASRMAADLEGVDVVVVGHSPDFKFVPDQVEKTLVVRSGTRGQYISVLELDLDDSGRMVDHYGEARPLGELVEQDKTLLPQVQEFNEKYDAMKAKDRPDLVKKEEEEEEGS
jgi:2',3'-cyclic-nucleotide 2'-phosphodiesterase (5'-nucleotidase family)